MPQRITLGELLHRQASRFADRPFVTMAPDGTTITYGEFERLVNRLGNGFRAQYGLETEHVAIMLPNSVAYLATSYALKKLDLVEVSVNRAFRGPALSRMINLTACRILFTSGGHFEVLTDIIDDLPYLTDLVVTDGADEAKALFPSLTVRRFEDLLSDCEDHIPSQASDTDAAVIMFTSGTTGPSKGCEKQLSHRYAVRTAENMIAPFRLTADDMNYTPYPLSHIGPAFYDILPMMMLGGRVGASQRFQPVEFLAGAGGIRRDLVHVPWICAAASLCGSALSRGAVAPRNAVLVDASAGSQG